MPLYEYRCRGCGVRFERLVRSTSSSSTGGTATAQQPAILCPKCQSDQVERLLSAFARTSTACTPTPGGGG